MTKTDTIKITGYHTRHQHLVSCDVWSLSVKKVLRVLSNILYFPFPFQNCTKPSLHNVIPIYHFHSGFENKVNSGAHCPNSQPVKLLLLCCHFQVHSKYDQIQFEYLKLINMAWFTVNIFFPDCQQEQKLASI